MKIILRSIMLAAGLAALPAVSIAATPNADARKDAERFGSLASIQQMSLSPNGTKAAYITPLNDGSVLSVVDLVEGGAPKAITKVVRDDGELQTCSWLTDDRLICEVVSHYTQRRPFLTLTRSFALDADGGNVVQISALSNARSLGVAQDGGEVIDHDIDGDPYSILMTRVFVPEDTRNTRLANTDQGLGVERVDTRNGHRRTVEQAKKYASTYLSDMNGHVRIMGVVQADNSGTLSGTDRYFYRKTGSDKWEPLSKTEYDGRMTDGFIPVHIDAGKNVVYGFQRDAGLLGLYSIALDGSMEKKKVVGRSDVDVDDLVTIGRDERVVGVSYATDKRFYQFFDPELDSLAKALGQALPHQPMINFLDASDGESKLLLEGSSDTDPGMTYLFDKEKRKLEAVLPIRPQLDGVKLAEMKPITYRAPDGTMIPGYLTLPVGTNGKNLPAIVMPHGGPSSRDEWGFDWFAQFFAARGYAVLQPEYRGSSGFGEAWFQQNGFKSWKTAIGDINDAGRWLEQQGIVAKGKLAIVGWSYGGYAALQSAVLDPDLYKAIVAVAPVTDLEMLRNESRDYTNHLLVEKMIGHGPYVDEGSPAQHADRFKAPVLMFHGDIDENVDVQESRVMEKRLKDAGKPVTYVEFHDLDHYLEDSQARTQMLSESDAFLRKTLGIK